MGIAANLSTEATDSVTPMDGPTLKMLILLVFPLALFLTAYSTVEGSRSKHMGAPFNPCISSIVEASLWLQCCSSPSSRVGEPGFPFDLKYDVTAVVNVSGDRILLHPLGTCLWNIMHYHCPLSPY